MAISTQKSINDYFLSDTNYVSAGDGEIYIGNILLDECYDIQYSYKEMKEPVYGYRSKYYSSVIPGTVLITGQFTINYIHDAYLYTLLTAQNEIPDTILSNAVSNQPMLQTGIKNKNLLQQYNYLRKKIDEENTNINTLRSKIAIYDSQLNAIEEAKDRVNENAISKSKNLKKQQDDWVESMWSSQEGKQERLANATEANDNYTRGMEAYQLNKNMINSGDYQNLKFDFSDEINQASAIIQARLSEYEEKDNLTTEDIDNIYELKTQLYQLNEQYKSAVSKFIEPSFFNTDARDLARFQVANTKNSLDERNNIENLSAQQDSIKALKESVNKKIKDIESLNAKLNEVKQALNANITASSFITQTGDSKFKKLDSGGFLSALAKQKDGKITSRRPEDIDNNLQLKFRYNNMVHKIITGVKLIGHSHLLGVGGQPVQETYIFLARQILNE
jgi:DNA repair exonuclease SbcCD ATPase subunit